MSLGTWFKEYVYIPLGGNKVGRCKQYRNLAIVWFLTGFWHGANWNYILWGVYFGAILMLEKTFLLKVLSKVPKFVRHVYALLLIGFGWIIFSYTDIGAGLICFASLFGIGTSVVATPTLLYQFIQVLPLLVVGILGVTPLPKKVWGGCEKELMWLKPILIMSLFLVCVAYLVDSTFSPFLYFIF